jgi:quinol monooxygenase YgiN
MSKISLIAKLTAAEGKADELKAALANLIAAADEEPGLEIYSVHADASDANVFYFFELYTDQAALDVHGKGDQMKAAMGAMGGLLAGRPEVSMLTPVVAKGMDVG